MFRPTPTALVFSVLLHGFAGYSIASFGMPAAPKNEQPIEISYVRYTPEPAPRPMPALDQAIPVPSRPAAPRAVRQASRPRGEMTDPTAPRRQYAVEEAPVPAPRPVPYVRESRDILKDPKRGRIFTSYFGAVKERINREVRRKYTREEFGTGSVTLIFILDKYGILENAWVSDRQSGAGPAAKAFAVRALRAASPFPSFPQDLDLPRIAFTVTVLFEEAGS